MKLTEKILLIFEKNRDLSISGQEIADDLGVSRNAVWKAINILRDDGYIIESCTNKGYRLSKQNDILDKNIISDYMEHNVRIDVFNSLDSTNNEAKRQLQITDEENFIIVSDCQTSGRGRIGRNFYSPEKTGIYMSLVIHPNTIISQSLKFTTLASVAVAKAIESLTDIKPQIKWVNDIYVSGKKICGILTEADTDFETGIVKSVIIGIGINITTASFPEDIQDKASSINFAGLQRNKMIAYIADNIINMYESGTDFMDYYIDHSYVIGKNIIYISNGKQISAYVKTINHEGGLEVILADGSTQILTSGEISILLK